jgi:hypothetical protein
MLWKRVRLLTNRSVREIVCGLMQTLDGMPTDFGPLADKLEAKKDIPYSTANQLIRQLASLKMVELTGGPRTGLQVRLNQFDIPPLNPKTIYKLERNRSFLPSS